MINVKQTHSVVPVQTGTQKRNVLDAGFRGQDRSQAGGALIAITVRGGRMKVKGGTGE